MKRLVFGAKRFEALHKLLVPSWVTVVRCQMSLKTWFPPINVDVDVDVLEV